MGNEICQGENKEPVQLPDQQSPESKQKMQMSTAVPYENGSSNNDIFRSEEEQKEDPLHQQQPEVPPAKLIMCSTPRKNPIRYETMQVIRLAEKKKRINQYEIDAPFIVIFLTLSPELKHTINHMGHDLFQKYYQQSGTSGWKLHKNGYYINYLAKKLTAILTQTLYFEGELAEDDSNRIYPKSTGILLNQNGRFEGEFYLGKANGKGSFEDHIKKAFYKGNWKDGKLVQGVIDSQQYRFKGDFQESMAHGRGQLNFKQNEVSYTGQFKKGKYYDRSATYETKDYIYQGCFINGKKNGDGALVEKERNYKNNKVKYKPPCQFEGKWVEDIYFNNEALNTVKAATKQQEILDSKASHEDEKVGFVVQQMVFEEENETIENKADQKVGKSPIDDFDMIQPRFVWVQPPRPEKKQKRKKKRKAGEEQEEEESQIF